jgi:hypothetical protein
MEQTKLFKQMIDFQKTTFDNSFKAMTTLQEQGEKMINIFLEQSPWLPDEGRKTITEWIHAYKKGREDFKNMVEDNFQKVQDFFANSDRYSE